MGFFRQEYWSGLPFPPPGDLPNPGIKPASPVSIALAGGFFFFFKPLSHLGSLGLKELKTKVLQCFFKYLFQLHKISTFSLARSTSSFFCWSIFSSAAFLVFLPKSFLCFCLSAVCRHSPPASALPSYHFPSSHFKKTTLFIDCLACFLPILHSPGRLGQSEWKYPDSMGKSPCHQGRTGLV